MVLPLFWPSLIPRDEKPVLAFHQSLQEMRGEIPEKFYVVGRTQGMSLGATRASRAFIGGSPMTPIKRSYSPQGLRR